MEQTCESCRVYPAKFRVTRTGRWPSVRLYCGHCYSVISIVRREIA